MHDHGKLWEKGQHKNVSHSHRKPSQRVHPFNYVKIGREHEQQHTQPLYTKMETASLVQSVHTLRVHFKHVPDDVFRVKLYLFAVVAFAFD